MYLCKIKNIYNMKSSKKKTIGLCFSIVANVILLAAIYHIGWSKTDYLHKVCYKYGLMQAPETEDPTYWVLDGWINTLKKLNYDADIVFFGNSITRGSNFSDFFPDKKICNLGYAGDNLNGMIKRVEMGQLQSVNPEKVFIMGGINGLESQSLEQFEQQYRNLIQIIHDSLPQATLYLESILPTNHQFENGANYADNQKIVASNEIIRNIAENYQATYIDLFSVYQENGELKADYTIDGVHLQSEHYDKWANAISTYIYEIK